MPRAGGNPAPRLEMFENRNLNWSSAIDVPVDPIVINTWYTPLEEIVNVKAAYLAITQTNNGATNEDIVAEITRGGVVSTWLQDAVNTQIYYLRFSVDGNLVDATAPFQVRSLDLDQSAPLETRALAIRVRQTSVVDLVAARINVRMVYGTLEEAG